MQHRWNLNNIKITNNDVYKSQELQLSPVVTSLLRKRNIDSDYLNDFLHPDLSQLDDPFKLHDMSKAVKLIHHAINQHKKIIVYSDYDMDGIGSNTIMYSVLKRLGANVTGYCPDRGYDGYGLNMHESKWIAKHHYGLVITTDNGISCYDEVQYLEKHHINVIIADHHQFPPKIPKADAIVMTLYPGHHYPNETDFCGAGIAFKIAQALLGRVPTEYLYIACLSTVADSVHAVKENRIIIKYGVKEMQDEPSLGIRALAHVADIDLTKLTSTELSFTLIPRFNSLGRMGHLGKNANLGRKLLLATNSKDAKYYAQITEKMNVQRQKIMNRDTVIAMKQASTPENLKRNTLVISDPRLFPGTVGIVASRLVEKYNKPTLVIGHLPSDPKNVFRGSGRSIPEFNMYAAMNPKNVRDDMISFGGHTMACGLSIHPEKISALRHDLEANSKKLGHVKPTVTPDCLLPVKNISLRLANQLKILEPFGVSNEQPLFCLRLPRIYNMCQMGKHYNHLSFTLGFDRHSTKCIGWRMGEYYHVLAKNPYYIEVAGHLNVNHWHGFTNVQIIIQAIHHYYPKHLVHNALGNIYGFLYQNCNNNYQIKVPNVFNYLLINTNFHKQFIIHALVIFKELGFLNIKNKIITLSKNPKKKSLTKAPSYNEFFPE